jgi:hypothetical protein
MATKTFKIGLSNTDKQNMAQDVYERLIAMCFDEYDSTKTYNKGDFVVYEDPSDTFKLYKCIADSTTGTWDSEDWELATFQDLVDDIESAVAFVNDKANVDGNYPTMTVGVADQLSPYDEESGDDQDEPFSFQATGTANGTQPDFATGSIALMKEKQGNSVVVNQIVHARTVSSTNNGITIASSNDYVFTVTVNDATSYHQIDLLNTREWLAGHKYLIIGSKKVVSSIDIEIYISGYGNNVSEYYIASITSTTNTKAFFYVGQSTPNGTYTVRPYIIDLTQWFNGDIPQDLLDHPENFFRYYQGSLTYNTGELVNANSRYIKCIGRNQWDEERKVGYYLNNGVETYVGDTYFVSKNYIKVIPGLDYILYGASGDGRVAFYDANKNFISDVGINTLTIPITGTRLFIVPYNAIYVRFYNPSTATQITLSIYYDGESGYDQYYPYEELTNTDTGTETLRKAGNAHDVKLPSGEITRNVGYVDLSTLSWTYVNGFLRATVTNIARNTGSQLPNISCSKYTRATGADVYNKVKDKTMCGNNGYFGTNEIIVYDTAYSDADTFKTAMSGVYLYYELETPTTEQGTTFSPNLIIDDFGSMSFEGTSGVPQGNLIFYPVDYKAFIDTLYDYVEGTPSELAKKTDLPTAPQTFLESISGYDATKTQTLKNIEGTLTWVDDE